MAFRILPRWTGWHQSHASGSSMIVTAGWPVSARDCTLTVPGWHPVPRLLAGGYSIDLEATHLWAKCLSVHKEVIVIDDRPDIVLELTTTWGSCRAAIMQTRRTLTWPEPFTYITTITNHLQQTSQRNQAFRFNNKAFRSNFSQPSKMHNQSLMSFMSFFFLALPPTYFLQIPLHPVFALAIFSSGFHMLSISYETSNLILYSQQVPS